MPFDAPFVLGPFVVNASGELTIGSRDRIPAFSVRWRDRQIHVRLAEAMPNPTERAGELDLRVVVGRVPSTAGGGASAEDVEERRSARMRAFATVRGLGGALPSGWRLALLPDHCITMENHVGVRLPATAVELLTEVTLLLLTLDPYLDMVDEAGVGFAAATAGAGAAATTGATAGTGAGVADA